MLRQVHIQRFKNIAELTLDLARVNVIVGGNNAGKSSIIQSIQFAVSVTQTAGLEKAAKWKGESLSTSVSATQFVYSPLRDVSALAPGGKLQQSEAEAIVVALVDESKGTLRTLVRRGKNKNIMIQLEGKTLGELIKRIDEPFSVFVPGLAGIPSAEEYKTPGVVMKAAAKGDANNVFRNVLWLLRQDKDGWATFGKDLRDVFPAVDVDVEFDRQVDDNITCNVRMDGKSLPIDAAGTSVLQVIQVLSYVNLYKPKLLIVDEPDSHLHPDNQRRLATVLIKLSEERDFQVIVTTHSRHLLDALTHSAQMHWLQNGKLVGERNPDLVPILLDLGALDKGELFQAGKYAYVVLTEDSRTEPIDAILASSDYPSDGVLVCPLHGCAKEDTAGTLIRCLKQLAPDTTVIVHRDRDYLTDIEVTNYCSKIESAGGKCFVTQGSDVEANFLDATHISQLYPALSMQDIDGLIAEAEREADAKSKEKFMNARKDAFYRKAHKQPDWEMEKGFEEEFERHPKRFRHGKSVFGILKGRLERELGTHVNLFRPSPHLRSETLVNIMLDPKEGQPGHGVI